jgi:hypothetical protein
MRIHIKILTTISDCVISKSQCVKHMYNSISESRVHPGRDCTSDTLTEFKFLYKNNAIDLFSKERLGFTSIFNFLVLLKTLEDGLKYYIDFVGVKSDSDLEKKKEKIEYTDIKIIIVESIEKIGQQKKM